MLNETEEKYYDAEDRQEIRNKSKEGHMRLINYETKENNICHGVGHEVGCRSP